MCQFVGTVYADPQTVSPSVVSARFSCTRCKVPMMLADESAEGFEIPATTMQLRGYACHECRAISALEASAFVELNKAGFDLILTCDQCKVGLRGLLYPETTPAEMTVAKEVVHTHSTPRDKITVAFPGRDDPMRQVDQSRFGSITIGGEQGVCLRAVNLKWDAGVLHLSPTLSVLFTQ
jgi:hypothetical protein